MNCMAQILSTSLRPAEFTQRLQRKTQRAQTRWFGIGRAASRASQPVAVQKTGIVRWAEFLKFAKTSQNRLYRLPGLFLNDDEVTGFEGKVLFHIHSRRYLAVVEMIFLLAPPQDNVFLIGEIFKSARCRQRIQYRCLL